MFDFFKKKTHKKLEIDLQNNSMIINGTILAFPLSLKDIEVVLGKPDRVVKKENKFIKYIYDKAGIVFEHSFEVKQHLKSCEVYIDEEHLITELCLYFGEKVKPMRDEEELPLNSCNTLITCNGKSPYFISDRQRVGDFNLILWTPYGTNFNGIAETITDTLSISYFPEFKHERESYKLKETDEEVLRFDNINFKLTIIQVLMYDLLVLKPYFDIYDFAEEFSEEEIDTESMEIIQPALDYMINLPIPKKYAEQVQEIDMDGGNEIYMNLNLKQATIISSNFEHVKKTFDKQGVQVKVL